uniref:GAF domain-containing protein n=1 Tax=Peronospora matthiolae TaxID=2874970 RepID=A0AAV1TKG0_9STRA
MTQSLDAALQLFTVTQEDSTSPTYVAESTVQPVVALFASDCKHPNRELQKLLMPLMFLFRNRHDITLVHSPSSASASPSLAVFKHGQKVVTVTTDGGELKDRVHIVVAAIGWSPDCPDETQLPNCLHPINAEQILSDVKAFTIAAGQRDYVANAANVSSIIWHAFKEAGRPINWSGFYFVRPLATPETTSGHDHILVLGPFMGKPACSRIRFQSGVCGAAWRSKSVQRIADVRLFHGHIACDGDSQSELVVPIVNELDDAVVAVVDLDCPVPNGFSAEDERTVGQVARLLADACDWTNLQLPFTTQS